MRRQFAIALTLSLAMGMAACDDDFLTTLPQDEISDAIFWQTERDFTMAVNAVYRSTLDTDHLFLDGTTDQLYSKKDWTVNHAYAMGHQDATSGWSGGIWERLYEGISRSNEVLTKLETSDADLSAEFRAEIEGQARFLRGYFYHELLWLFGEVPLYTSVPTIEEAREATRPSRDEVIAFILADLNAAAAALPGSRATASSMICA